MLMGCREFLKLDAFDAIVEGDTFCAIQCGSTAATCPWQLADWVDGLQYISRQLRCTFS